MDKKRFKELYQLAHGGDMVAKADLWLEFEFAYDHDPLPDFMQDSVEVIAPADSNLPSSHSSSAPENNQRASASICGSKKQSAPPSCLRSESPSGGRP